MTITQSVNKQIAAYIKQADMLAIAELKRLVLKVFQQYPDDIVGFNMSMGSWVFVTKNDHMIGTVWAYPEQKDYPMMSEVEDFINEWDDTLKLTGIPLDIFINSEFKGD